MAPFGFVVRRWASICGRLGIVAFHGAISDNLLKVILIKIDADLALVCSHVGLGDSYN